MIATTTAAPTARNSRNTPAPASAPTITAVPDAASPTTDLDRQTTPRWRTGLLAGVAAAGATSAVAAIALAADVPLEIQGEQIPVAGFTQLTFICSVLGLLIAKATRRWTARPQRAFLRVTLALTALSFLPDLTASATTATKLVLMTTHLVAAIIVIPALARRLPENR